MNTHHLSEEEIQQYALGQTNLNMMEHIDSCALCEAKTANYHLIFSEIDQLPKLAFDFDVASLVIARLPEPKIALVGGERWLYLLVFAALASITIPVYLYRAYFF